MIKMIPVGQLVSEGAERDAELVESIRRIGLLNPLTVRAAAGKYEVVWGRRRLAACAELGMREVPCVVAEITDQQLAEVASVRSSRSRTPTNQYHAAVMFLYKRGVGLEDIAKGSGVSVEELASRAGLPVGELRRQCP